jgi:proteasome beta subunit
MLTFINIGCKTITGVLETDSLEIWQILNYQEVLIMTEIEARKTGTTTLGLVCRDAVIVAADRKATMGYMVESKEERKVYPIDKHIALTIAGGVGDAQTLVRMLKAQFKLYKMERGPITLKAASTLLANVLQGSKYFPYYVQLILAGYDSEPRVYSVDMAGGVGGYDKYYSTGSGSPFVYGVLESAYKENMSVEDAIALAVKAVKAAVQRDIASGGNGMIVAVIDRNGYRELTAQELKQHM